MDYYNTHGLSQTLSKIPLIAPEDIEPDSLVQFLNKALEDYPDLLAVGKGHQSRSQFRKSLGEMSILNGYVVLPMHRAARFILERMMTAQ